MTTMARTYASSARIIAAVMRSYDASSESDRRLLFRRILSELTARMQQGELSWWEEGLRISRRAAEDEADNASA